MCPSASKKPEQNQTNHQLKCTTWRAGRKYSLSLQGSGTQQKHRELMWRCLPLIWGAFSKANTSPIPVWIRIIPDWGSSSGAPDMFQVLSYSGQQIHHTVKHTHAQNQRSDQIEQKSYYILSSLRNDLDQGQKYWKRREKNSLPMPLWCQFCE